MSRVPAVRLMAAATVLALALGGAGRAVADWPVSRHDPARTGTATGHSDLRTPAAY